MTTASLEGSRALARVCTRALPRIHVLSDLHLESGTYELDPTLECDIIVAAGDIGPVEVAVPWLASLGKPVVYVLGNHEHWNSDFLEALRTAKRLAAGTQVHVLERDAVTIEGVRFLGATLWTDLGERNPTFVTAVYSFMRDYQRITADGWLASAPNRKAFEKEMRALKGQALVRGKDGAAGLHPLMTYVEHQRTVAWLQRMLSKSPRVPTVVVTHHAPSFESVIRNGVCATALTRQRWGFRDDEPARIAGYASNLLASKLTERQRAGIVFWAHGHTHSAMEYLEQGVHVVCNPRGRQRRPLTEESARSFALFGAHVTAEDIARSQAEFAARPWVGDGWGFERNKVIQLARPRRALVAKACAEPLAALLVLLEDIRVWASVGGTGRGARRQAVTFSMQTSLAKFGKVLEDVRQKGLAALDADALPGFGSASALTPPQLYSAKGFDAVLTPADFQRALRQAEAAVAQVRQLPFFRDLYLQEWAQRAIAVVTALAEKGVRARICGLPESAFKGTNRAEIRLVVQRPTSVDVEHIADVAANQGKMPRKWLVWLVETPEDAGRPLPLQFVQALAEMSPLELCVPFSAEEQTLNQAHGFLAPD